MARTDALVTLPDDSVTTVVLEEGGSVDGHFARILADPAVKAAIDRAAKDANPWLHYRHGNDVIEKKQAGKVVDAFLEAGDIAAAEEIIEGWVDEGSYYQGLVAENFRTDDEEEGWGLLLASSAEAIASATGEDVDATDLEEAFESEALDALSEADESEPLEQMEQALRIGVVYVPGKETGLGVDDMAMSAAFGREVSAETVRPDENFRRFLEFANLGFDDFREAVLNSHGKDLYALTADDGASELRREDVARASEAWRGFAFEADPSRPALITAGQAVELLDNASYGGVPVVYAYVEAKPFLDLPWPTDLGEEGALDRLRLAPEDGRKKILVGIHDFMNGSGHSVDVSGPVELPLDHRAWHVDGVRHRWGIDSLYCLSNDVFQADVTAVPAPAPEAGSERVAAPGM